MKYLLTIFAVIFSLATVCIFTLFVLVFIAWLNGAGNVLLPGLGLVIAVPLVLILLFIIGIIMLSLTVWLFRMIFKPLP